MRLLRKRHGSRGGGVTIDLSIRIHLLPHPNTEKMDTNLFGFSSGGKRPPGSVRTVSWFRLFGFFFGYIDSHKNGLVWFGIQTARARSSL